MTTSNISPIRIGIVGYGNLAKGVECAIPQNPDLTLSAVFTRREPASITLRTPGVPVCSLSDILQWKEQIDVLILCTGSAADLPTMTPQLAAHFNLVDSFDHHSCIPEHYRRVNTAASEGGTLCLISAGWDPGLFSLNRAYAQAVLPEGHTYTFWGTGVSQGHSDAIRQIPGVLDARQYTIPVRSALEQIRRGSTPTLLPREQHTRSCYVVAAEGADHTAIEQAIKTMPGYFAEYDTTVQFITAEELQRDHQGLPHGGTVIRGGLTGLKKEHHETIEYHLQLDSNPQFTGSVLTACARAVYAMYSRRERGCRTMLDIAPADLLSGRREDLIQQFL